MVGPRERGQRFVPVKKARPAKNPGFTALERPIQIASLSTSSLSLVILSSGRRKKGRRKARFLIILKTLLHRVVPRHERNVPPNDLPSFRYPLGPRRFYPRSDEKPSRIRPEKEVGTTKDF